jgi:hypothetical protein
MKKNGSRNQASSSEIFSVRRYTGGFFGNTMPCESCGEAPNTRQALLDEHSQVLHDEAARLAYHAQSEIHAQDYEDAAGMLRDAARLLDLAISRRRAAQEAREQGKAMRHG